MTSSSAPGKIILFGEHAVVYGRPALAVPVSQVRATATVHPTQAGIWIHAPQVNLQEELSRLAPDHPLAVTVRSVFSALAIATPPPFRLHIESDIPVAAGLGSGAAVSVAVLRALSAFLGRPLEDEAVNAMAYEIEKLYHGTPSGIDNTVVTYAQPVYFVKGKPVERLRVGKPFTLIIGDSGVPALTRDSVAAVRRLWESAPHRYDRLFDRIASLVQAARRAIESGDVLTLGPLMNENHAHLQALTVSSPELDRLTEAARAAGALGAKLSGGGRGGNIIALAPSGALENVCQALQQAGAKRVIVTQVAPPT